MPRWPSRLIGFTWPTVNPGHGPRREIHLENGQFYYLDRQTGVRQDLDRPETFLLPASVGFIDLNNATADSWDNAAGLRCEAEVDALIRIRTTEELEADGVFDVARLLVQRVGGRLFTRCETGTPFWYAYTVLGFSGMMVMMQERPELFCHIMERKHRQRLEVCRGFARAGVNGVWVEEALSSADIISPLAYERFAFPTTRAYLQELNHLGLATVLYYCGDSIPRLPWLKRLGMAALALEESKKSFQIDIEQVIAGVEGACAVFGNIHAVDILQSGTPEQIEAEVRRQIQAGQQAKGFLVCQGSPLPLDTSPARLDLLIPGGACRPISLARSV